MKDEFIQLTQSQGDKESIIIRVSSITAIMPDEDGESRIYVADRNSNPFCVKESFEEIKTKLGPGTPNIRLLG